MAPFRKKRKVTGKNHPQQENNKLFQRVIFISAY